MARQTRRYRHAWVLRCVGILPLAISVIGCQPGETIPAGRDEVIFWHFWGGAEREVVERVVQRFNESQDEHFVRAVAMSGNNLDLKLFLSVTGGKPPDVVNQDDPILADWASRGALLALDEFVEVDELQQLRAWLLPGAWELTAWDGRAFGLCNGLDVRALLYNQTLLEAHGIVPPKTLAELDELAVQIAPPGASGIEVMGFLPRPRNLWAWGVVFGGNFYDQQANRATFSSPGVVDALQWMASFGRRYGEAAISFRTRDQSLPGQSFSLTSGRYAAVVDGQWRVRDIRQFQEAQQAKNEPVTQFGVTALPRPENGRERAGWINGNFFLVPRGAANPVGGWEFMKFWSGFDGHEDEAAATAIAGGWIPVSEQVIAQREFAVFLEQHPLFAEFIRLATSPNQIPRPNVPGAMRMDRELRNTAESAMLDPDLDVQRLLTELNERLNRQLLGNMPRPETKP